MAGRQERRAAAISVVTWASLRGEAATPPDGAPRPSEWGCCLSGRRRRRRRRVRRDRLNARRRSGRLGDVEVDPTCVGEQVRHADRESDQDEERVHAPVSAPVERRQLTHRGRPTGLTLPPHDASACQTGCRSKRRRQAGGRGQLGTTHTAAHRRSRSSRPSC